MFYNNFSVKAVKTFTACSMVVKSFRGKWRWLFVSVCAISDILVNEHGPFCVSLEKCLCHEVVNSFVGVICHISVYSDCFLCVVSILLSVSSES